MPFGIEVSRLDDSPRFTRLLTCIKLPRQGRLGFHRLLPVPIAVILSIT